MFGHLKIVIVIKTLKGVDKNNEVLDVRETRAGQQRLLGEAMITTCAVRKVMLLCGEKM